MAWPTVTDDSGEGTDGSIFCKALTDAIKVYIDATPRVARTSVVVDLSGAAAVLVALHAERAITLTKATLLYTEASSGDAGIAIKIGKETDDDYYFSGTSEVSKSQWYTKDVTLLQTAVTSGDTILLSSAGGKTGTGEIILVLDYYFT